MVGSRAVVADNGIRRPLDRWQLFQPSEMPERFKRSKAGRFVRTPAEKRPLVRRRTL